MPCTIRDVSPRGARLDVPDARYVGYAIDLRDVMTGAVRRCSVAWRDGTALGVRFLDSGDWPKIGHSATTTGFGRRWAEPT